MQQRLPTLGYALWLVVIGVFALLHALHLKADFPNHTIWFSDWAKYTDEGGPGALMPAFGRRHGGFLTEEQVNILADGIVRRWGLSGALGSMKAPAYAASQPGDRAAGKTLFENNCQRCHQLSGKQQVRDASGTVRVVGPVTEPEFLALVSDQNLRSTIIAGKPDEGMPDWRGYGAGPLSDQQVTDIVAWLGSERRQPIQNQEKPQGEKP